MSAGNVVPSPSPSNVRRAIKPGAPAEDVENNSNRINCLVFIFFISFYSPTSITKGVIKVKRAVNNIPMPNTYFPPNFSAIIPPGICVTT